MDQTRKVAKPACGQLYPSMVSTYICTCTALLFLLVYIPGTSIFFIWQHVKSFTVHYCKYICVTTAVCVCRTVVVFIALKTGQGLNREK